jgi:hypothetical protein
LASSAILLLVTGRIGVFLGMSLILFLGLLALLVALALVEGEGLISCRENCPPSDPLLGRIPLWRILLAAGLAVGGGVIAFRRFA